MLASILLAACMVPERLHLTELVFGNDAAVPAIRERLKTESFAAVAKSISADNVADRGWFSRDQLSDAGYATATKLTTGGFAETGDNFQHGFVHVDEVREPMTCDRAIASYPQDEWPYITRAAARFTAGDRHGAIADYTTLVQINPRSYEGRYGRASVYFVQQDYNKALDDARIASAVAGFRGDPDVLLGFIQESLGDDDLATASEGKALAQYHGREQDESRARYGLGIAYSNLGYFSAAIDEFDIALKKTQDSDFFAARAFAWFSLENFTNADADYHAAVRLGPTLSRPYLGLAVMSFARGNNAEAQRYAERATANDLTDAYAALWVLVSERAQHQPARVAGASFAKSKAWPVAAINVFLGRLPVASLDAAASSPDPFTERLQRCEARFYGALYLLTGFDPAAALPRLQAAATQCPYREYERSAAQHMLRVITMKSARQLQR